MQNKSFIRSIFRNEPSDLQIKKPAVLPSGNGVNRTVFHFTPITTGNIFSRKKLLTSPCQILFHSHFLFSQALTLRHEQPHLHFLPFVPNRSIRSNNSNVKMLINGVSIEIDTAVSEDFLGKLIKAVCHA